MNAPGLEPRTPVWWYAAAALVAALGGRVVYLFAAYLGGDSGVHRFHVEAAAVAFVAVGLALRLAARQSGDVDSGTARLPRWLWPVFAGLAALLYWPALGVGFLADDFVLLSRAGTWELGPVTPSLFRPLPIAGWAVLLAGNAGAPVFHLVNVVLHGTNAYLTSRLAEGWVRARVWSIVAGCLVLTAPLATEAVVWASGVFDVSATTLVLTGVLLARRYSGPINPARRMLFVVAGLLALTAKETAAVAGALVLVDALARRAFNRRLLIDTGILLLLAGVFSVVRLLQAFGTTTPELTRYLIQRGLFENYGGFAVPWHAEVIQALPWLAAVCVAIIVALLAHFFLMRSRTIDRQVIAAAVWMLVAVLPVFTFLYVGQDLQGARFLYLATPGWAGLVSLLASAPAPPLGRMLSLVAVAALAAAGVIGVAHHLQPWKEAAEVRGRIEHALQSNETIQRCQSLTLAGLPDTVRGAYVFRNGAHEAVRRLSGQKLIDTPEDGCTFEWREDLRTFVTRK